METLLPWSPEQWKLLSLLNSYWDLNSNEVGITLKHPETINGNVKNLSRRIENERYEKYQLLLRLPFNATDVY